MELKNICIAVAGKGKGDHVEVTPRVIDQLVNNYDGKKIAINFEHKDENFANETTKQYGEVTKIYKSDCNNKIVADLVLNEDGANILTNNDELATSIEFIGDQEDSYRLHKLSLTNNPSLAVEPIKQQIFQQQREGGVMEEQKDNQAIQQDSHDGDKQQNSDVSYNKDAEPIKDKEEENKQDEPARDKEKEDKSDLGPNASMITNLYDKIDQLKADITALTTTNNNDNNDKSSQLFSTSLERFANRLDKQDSIMIDHTNALNKLSEQLSLANNSSRDNKVVVRPDNNKDTSTGLQDF